MLNALVLLVLVTDLQEVESLQNIEVSTLVALLEQQRALDVNSCPTIPIAFKTFFQFADLSTFIFSASSSMTSFRDSLLWEVPTSVSKQSFLASEVGIVAIEEACRLRRGGNELRTP